MAQDTSLNGLRNQILTSIFGRRLGFDSQGFLVGPNDIRNQVEGVSSAGSTITSTSVTSPLSNWGVSLVGASGATATTGYTLTAPQPGVYKTLFVATTGYAVITTTTISTGAGTAGAFICSSGSVTSTHQTITMSGKGASLTLIGITTGLWGALLGAGQLTSVSTQISIS